jgi:16S rRNA U516 pseudouridylate synthase RsuA-like enzyme
MTTPLVDIVSNLTTLDTSEARRVIVAGNVRVNGTVVDDPAARVEPPALVACGPLTFGITE